MKLPLSDRMIPLTAALAAILLAFGFAATATAATDKSGVIEDETWSLAMSPIRIVGDISVYSLTSQPGVEVLFTGNFEFDCPGTLTAVGTAASKIWFHGDTGPVTWKGLKFLNSPDGSVLDYCIVENSNDHGIEITNSAPAISNCEIKNNTTAATTGGAGIYILINVAGSSIPSLNNCDITNNSNSCPSWGGGGMWFEVNIPGTVVISDCNFNNNLSSPTGAGGLALTSGNPGTIIRLTDCQINDNSISRTNNSVPGAGAYLFGSGKIELLRCSIHGNIASLIDNSGSFYDVQGGGLYLYSGTLVLRNCDLQDNRVQTSGTFNNSRAWGGGLYVNSGNASLYNCLIRDNVVSGGGGSSGGGITTAGGTLNVENCTIVNNVGAGFHLSAGTIAIRNSVVFFNNANGTQIANGATTNVTYSDVQNGYTGTGNISTSPLLNADLTLNSFSPCVDTGSPEPSDNDLCFYDATTTPWGSLGTARNDMGAYGGPGACLWEPGSVSLMVLAPTGGGLVGVGDNVTLTVQASGIGPFTYVWKKGGAVISDIPGHISGANSAALIITGATAADAGNYTVEVTNALGVKLTSAVAAVAVSPLRVNVKMFAGLIIQADPGKTVKVEYSNDLSSGSWTTLTQLVLPSSPYTYYDGDSPNHPKRFYRATEVP